MVKVDGRGRLQKSGNTHLRRLLVEAAWSYRYKPALQGEIKTPTRSRSRNSVDFLEGSTPVTSKKYTTMLSKGKPSGKAIVAVARELSGFIWSVARGIEETRRQG
ncbi:transposase [Paenibacillus rhizoplanae]